jgi:hypothetical protein
MTDIVKDRSISISNNSILYTTHLSTYLHHALLFSYEDNPIRVTSDEIPNDAIDTDYTALPKPCLSTAKHMFLYSFPFYFLYSKHSFSNFASFAVTFQVFEAGFGIPAGVLKSRARQGVVAAMHVTTLQHGHDHVGAFGFLEVVLWKTHINTTRN